MKKELLEKLIKDLPNEFSIDDLIEKLLVIEKIEKGLDDIKKGKTIPHKQVKREVKKWKQLKN